MNKLEGSIVSVQFSQHMSIVRVDVDGDVFSSIVLQGDKGPGNYRTQDSITLLFKETEVGIAKNLSGLISFRNRFKAVITKIDTGLLLAKVTLDYKGHAIESVISAQSAAEMGLREQDEVEWLVKTNEVTLMKSPT